MSQRELSFSVQSGEIVIRIRYAFHPSGASPVTQALSEVLPVICKPCLEDRLDAPAVCLVVDSWINGESVYDTIDLYVDHLLETQAVGKSIPPPLILTSRREEFQTGGLDFPNEFLFDLPKPSFDVANEGNTQANNQANNGPDIGELRIRILSLGWLWAGPRQVESQPNGNEEWTESHQNDFLTDHLRDCLVGGFRARLRLDPDHHHDGSGLLRSLRYLRDIRIPIEATTLSINRYLEEVLAWRDKAIDDLIHIDFCVLQPRPSVFQRLFSGTSAQIAGYSNEIRVRAEQIVTGTNEQIEIAEQLSALSKEALALREISFAFERALPTRCGSFSCNLPSLKQRFLLVDDEASEVRTRLRRHPLYPAEITTVPPGARTGALGDLLTVDWPSRFLSAGQEGGAPTPDYTFSTLSHSVAELMRSNKRLDIDAILLDLSLGEGQDEERGGLQLLAAISSGLPTVPILIYSSYSSPRHIIQAIRRGAHWYCRKSEPSSVLRSVLELTSSVEWRRELESFGSRDVWLDESAVELDAADSYLLRKLVSGFPIGQIKPERLGGGIGGAKTLRVDALLRGEPVGVPFVAKIDRPFRMYSERQRYQRFVRTLIPNRVGRIDEPLIQAGRSHAAIAYSFSGSYHGSCGRRAAITQRTLKSHLRERLNKDIIPPFSTLIPMFEELLNESIGVLHSQSPGQERSAWREPFFGEARSLRESAELRLPVIAFVDLLELSRSHAQPWECPADGAFNFEENSVIVLPSCYIEDVEEDSITVIQESDGSSPRTYRIKLVGHLAEALARHRSLRQLQRFCARGRVTETRARHLEEYEEELKVLPYFRGLPGTTGCYDQGTKALPTLIPMAFEEQDWDFPFAEVRVRQVLDFLEVAQDRVGVVHGDLNLGNVIVELSETTGLLVQPWLIDFARTRRDAVAVDFVELEVDLVTQLLDSEFFGKENGSVLVTRVRDFISLFDRTVLEFRMPARSNYRLGFLLDAVSYVRRKAAEAGVLRLDYQALLFVYYLIALKIQFSEVKRARADQTLLFGEQEGKDKSSGRPTIASSLEGIADRQSPGAKAGVREKEQLIKWRQLLCHIGGGQAYTALRDTKVRVSACVVARVAVSRGANELYLLRLRPGRRSFTPPAVTISTEPDSMLVALLARLECNPEATPFRGPERERLCYYVDAFSLNEVETEMWRLGLKDHPKNLRRIERSVGEILEVGSRLSGGNFQQDAYIVSAGSLYGCFSDYDFSDRVGAEGTLTRRLAAVYRFPVTEIQEESFLHLGDETTWSDKNGVYLLADKSEILAGSAARGRDHELIFPIGPVARNLVREERESKVKIEFT